MATHYCLDTNSLLDSPELIPGLLQAGHSVSIPLHVVLELDALKKKAHLRERVADTVAQLHDNFENIEFLTDTETGKSGLYKSTVDLTIIKELESKRPYSPVLVTSDRIMSLLARIEGVASEAPEKCGDVDLSPSERHTGFVDSGCQIYPNSFTWESGRPVYHRAKGEAKVIAYENEVWKLAPKNVYQNLAMELLLDEAVDLVTLQSPAGFGKTMCALAAGLFLTLEEKRYDKIYVIKATKEVDESLGFLPGDIKDKISPYFSYLDDLILKLHETRPANRIFKDVKDPSKGLDPKKFDTVPLQYLRGKNIENAFVIIDEAQNISRHGIRTVLTRMGNNVKCVCLGDVRQIDNENLNSHDNGLSWVVKKCLGANNYAHLVMKGQKSRGPITDLVLQNNL